LGIVFSLPRIHLALIATAILAPAWAPRVSAQSSSEPLERLERALPDLTSLAARPRTDEAALVDRVVAWVDDEALTLTELEEALVRYQSEGLVPAGPADDTRLRAALERWIDETLLLAAAKKAGIKVPPETVDNRVDAMISELEKRHGSKRALDDLLARAGQDRDVLREELREQLLREWTIARAVGERITLTDADVARFEAERREKGLPTVRYHLSHLFFPVSPDALEKRWSQVVMMAHDARLEAERRGNFGEAATELARRYSLEGATGGSLGAVAPDELQPELAAALQNLEPGQSTRPIRTQKGVHVLYLERKTTARQTLFALRFEEEWQRRAKELRNGASIQIAERILPER
jgi:peptidyl-prolyl cis-trans isomerase SurA